MKNHETRLVEIVSKFNLIEGDSAGVITHFALQRFRTLLNFDDQRARRMHERFSTTQKQKDIISEFVRLVIGWKWVHHLTVIFKNSNKKNCGLICFKMDRTPWFELKFKSICWGIFVVELKYVSPQIRIFCGGSSIQFQVTTLPHPNMLTLKKRTYRLLHKDHRPARVGSLRNKGSQKLMQSSYYWVLLMVFSGAYGKWKKSERERAFICKPEAEANLFFT